MNADRFPLPFACVLLPTPNTIHIKISTGQLKLLLGTYTDQSPGIEPEYLSAFITLQVILRCIRAWEVLLFLSFL